MVEALRALGAGLARRAARAVYADVRSAASGRAALAAPRTAEAARRGPTPQRSGAGGRGRSNRARGGLNPQLRRRVDAVQRASASPSGAQTPRSRSLRTPSLASASAPPLAALGQRRPQTRPACARSAAPAPAGRCRRHSIVAGPRRDVRMRGATRRTTAPARHTHPSRRTLLTHSLLRAFLEAGGEAGSRNAGQVLRSYCFVPQRRIEPEARSSSSA